MPCRSDYLEASNTEIEAAKVLALLDELKTGTLPNSFGDGYISSVYNKDTLDILRKKVPVLCKKLQKVDTSKYSLELQLWWRDHQKADKERIEKELALEKELADKEKALAKLTPYERNLLGFHKPLKLKN